MTGTTLPDWLSSAVAKHLSRERPAASSVDRLRCGDLLVVDPVRTADTQPRVVLVIGIDSMTCTADVLLTTELLEAKTDRDVLLRSSLTGAPYPLLAHLDIAGPVLLSQFRSRVGRLGNAGAERLLSSPDAARSSLVHRGLPLRGKGDPRWPFLEAEVTAMEQLTAAAVAYLDEAPQTRPTIDPGLLLSETVDVTTAALLVDLVASGRAQLPVEVVDELVNPILDNPEGDSSPFYIDLWKALRPYIAVDPSVLVGAPTTSKALRCTPPREPGRAADAFLTLVAAKQIQGELVLRIITDRALWQDNLDTVRARGCVVVAGSDVKSQVVPIELEALGAAH